MVYNLLHAYEDASVTHRKLAQLAGCGAAGLIAREAAGRLLLHEQPNSGTVFFSKAGMVFSAQKAHVENNSRTPQQTSGMARTSNSDDMLCRTTAPANSKPNAMPVLRSQF